MPTPFAAQFRAWTRNRASFIAAVRAQDEEAAASTGAPRSSTCTTVGCRSSGSTPFMFLSARNRLREPIQQHAQAPFAKALVLYAKRYLPAEAGRQTEADQRDLARGAARRVRVLDARGRARRPFRSSHRSSGAPARSRTCSPAPPRGRAAVAAGRAQRLDPSLHGEASPTRVAGRWSPHRARLPRRGRSPAADLPRLRDRLHRGAPGRRRDERRESLDVSTGRTGHSSRARRSSPCPRAEAERFTPQRLYLLRRAALADPSSPLQRRTTST